MSFLSAGATAAVLVMFGGAGTAFSQHQAKPAAAASAEPAASAEREAPAAPQIQAVPESATATSAEQGQTPLTDTFEYERREWRLEKRRKAIEDTQFDINFRSFYFSREKFEGTRSEAFAIGGWAGLKTGYFLDHVAFGVTGYTSQKLSGDDDEDGTLLLAPGQEGYTVLGEAYADIRIIDDLNLYVGRKAFDTPFINRNDARMTPNTFEAIVLMGKSKLENGGVLKYGGGYFDRIKERNSDEFVPMSIDAGSDAERGVYTPGILYEKGNFSIGAIDYFSPDIINIGYFETKYKFEVTDFWQPSLAVQLVDQRSTGDDLLQGDDFSAQQFGIKVDLPVYNALFTAAYTEAAGGSNLQNPWSGYPGYTSVQVQDFNRAGEGAFLLRAAYDFQWAKGLSAYALAVFGTSPEDEAGFRQDEYDLNVQYAPPEGMLKGLSLRLRYALVQQDGGDVDDLKDFRAILNYSLKF
ncbi:MAG: outer membrane porin, OprD family [Verrucomicrobiaceae bacterium]|nr:MAG: outer membrane porin, OprD family [Verrucomicrobiaceae bacterium]